MAAPQAPKMAPEANLSSARLSIAIVSSEPSQSDPPFCGAAVGLTRFEGDEL